MALGLDTQRTIDKLADTSALFMCIARAHKMPHKQNLVLYLDKEIVEKTRELGFNLSKNV